METTDRVLELEDNEFDISVVVHDGQTALPLAATNCCCSCCSCCCATAA